MWYDSHLIYSAPTLTLQLFRTEWVLLSNFLQVSEDCLEVGPILFFLT